LQGGLAAIGLVEVLAGTFRVSGAPANETDGMAQAKAQELKDAKAGRPGGAKLRRVRIGDEIDGWRVIQIEQLSLVLTLDNRSATLTLFTGHPKRFHSHRLGLEQH
jgi:hypothetical protein